MIFLSNYNLAKNVENLLLDEVVFRVESLVEGAGSTLKGVVFLYVLFQKGNF